MKEFLNKKWHLHLLTLPLGILFIHYSQEGFLELNSVSYFWLGVLTAFLSFCLGFSIEFLQGVIFGANKTKEEVKQSNIDILVCGLGGTLAVVFGDNLLIALYSFVGILVIELYRILKNKSWKRKKEK